MKRLLIFLVAITNFITVVNAQWQQCASGIAIGAKKIAIKDTFIFVGTTATGIYLSTNNGDTWSATNNGFPSTGDVFDIAIKGTNVFACPWGGGVYLSTDNGASWVAVNNGLTELNITSLAVVGTNLFAGTFSSGVFLSTDDGSSWSAVNNGITDYYVTSLAVSGTKLYAGTRYWNGGVFLSTNNGANWSLVSTGLPAEDVRQLAATDTSVFVAYGFPSATRGIYSSINNGTNWSQYHNGLTDTTIQSIKVLGTNLFTCTGFDGVFVSPINVANWSAFNDNWTGSIDIIDFAKNETFIFAVDGGMWRRGLDELPVSIQEVKKEEENVRVYPNPTKDKLTIESKTIVKEISIISLLGNEVMKILVESNKIQLDVSRLNEGVYTIKVELPNKVIIKKFSIIK